MRTLAAILLALAAAACAACGGDEDPCEEYGHQICDLACECGDGECAIIDGDATISFETKSDCTGFYITLGCSGDSSDFDFEGCSAALANAACGENSEGETGIVYPDDPACQAQ
jgi:hypothetical protein